MSGALLLTTFLLTAAAPPPPQARGRSDGEWPKTIPLGERSVIVDTPHAESLEGSSLAARGSIGLVKEGATDPIWGSIWYQSDVVIDRERREVTLTSVRVPRVQIEGLGPAQEERLAGRLGQALTRRQIRLRLDDVLASVSAARFRGDAPPRLGTDPPKILFETEPAVLVVFDGEPRFKAVEGSRLERAMNTAFLVLRDPNANAYYLDGGATWFRAPDPAGPWTSAKPPAEALEIARRDREQAGVSDKDMAKSDEPADDRVPKVLVATEPTELLVSDGPARWGVVVEGQLETLSSSDNDVFRTPDRKVWVVLSGRWYRSDSLNGPWTFVKPRDLPGSFRRIPPDSPKADVLAFVPDTRPAHEALEDSSTPRTAAVRRKDAHVNVSYDGEPRFEPVPGTRVEYAVNTPDQVLRIQGRFFVVDQGVWFTSGSPVGPWAVADSIPEEEIQTIPPQSPVYNTRYVHVYDATPDVVYTAYWPAYLGSYPYGGTVWFGTGWAYRPWWGAYYYPRPWTWGFHAFYRPWAGWGWGFAWRPAWAGFRWGFGWGWGARWCGPGGFYRPAFARYSRTVNITRNVNVTRNVYNNGANRTRAVTQTSPRTASAATARGTSAARPPATAQKGHAQSKGAGAAGKGATGKKGAPKSGKGGAKGHGGGKNH